MHDMRKEDEGNCNDKQVVVKSRQQKEESGDARVGDKRFRIATTAGLGRAG